MSYIAQLCHTAHPAAARPASPPAATASAVAAAALAELVIAAGPGAQGALLATTPAGDTTAGFMPAKGSCASNAVPRLLLLLLLLLPLPPMTALLLLLPEVRRNGGGRAAGQHMTTGALSCRGSSSAFLG